MHSRRPIQHQPRHDGAPRSLDLRSFPQKREISLAAVTLGSAYELSHQLSSVQGQHGVVVHGANRRVIETLLRHGGPEPRLQPPEQTEAALCGACGGWHHQRQAKERARFAYFVFQLQAVWIFTPYTVFFRVSLISLCLKTFKVVARSKPILGGLIYFYRLEIANKRNGVYLPTSVKLAAKSKQRTAEYSGPSNWLT